MFYTFTSVLSEVFVQIIIIIIIIIIDATFTVFSVSVETIKRLQQ